MEQVENINYDNGNIISEDEANDIYYLGSMENKYGSMSMPQVDNVDASGNKSDSTTSEPPQVDNFDVDGNKSTPILDQIGNVVEKVGTAINDQDTTLGKIGEDTFKAVTKGATLGINEFGKSTAELAGLPVDIANKYVFAPIFELLGIEASKIPFMGSESNLKALETYVDLVKDVFPSFIEEPINEWANKPFNYETYGNIAEDVARFGIVAVPAAKVVGMMSSANHIVRGFAWGAIADYSATNPDDPALATAIAEYFDVNVDQLEPWAKNAISVLEKHDTDGIMTRRLKQVIEGIIIGGAAEAILPLVKGIIKATSIVPWKKTVTPLVAAGASTVSFSEDAEGSLLSGFFKALTRDENQFIKNTLGKNKNLKVSFSEVKQKALEIKNQYRPDKGWLEIKVNSDKQSPSFKINKKGEIEITWAKPTYGFHTHPGKKLKGAKQAAANVQHKSNLVNRMVTDVSEVVKRANSGDQAAIDIINQASWYRSMRTRLRQEFGGMADVFADIIGATSAQTNVQQNYENAIAVLRQFTKGDFDAEIKLFQDRIKKGGSLDPTTLTRMHKDPNNPFKLITKASGALFNTNSPAATGALLDMFRQIKVGASPKTINFAGNLIGFGNEATIDVWAARYLRDAAGLPRIPPPAEKAVAGKHLSKSTFEKPIIGSEFGFGQEVFEDAVKIINQNGEVKAFNSEIGNLGADDLQAVIWFLEKEKWTKSGWTTKAGEGGSLDFESVYGGSQNFARTKELRSILNSDFQPPIKRKKDTEQEHIERVQKLKAQDLQVKEDATAELKTLEGAPQRFVGGVAMERPGKVPTNVQQAQLSEELTVSIKQDPKVIGFQAPSSIGRFDGDNERSINLEVITQTDFDPAPLILDLVKAGKKYYQDSVFISKVVKADTPNARPGGEIYFKTPRTKAQLIKLSEKLKKFGIDGFTLTTVTRQSDRAVVQSKGNKKTATLTGIRFQYIPEFAGTINDPNLAKIMDDKVETFTDVMQLMLKEDGVTYADVVYYDTTVFVNRANPDTNWIIGGKSYDEIGTNQRQSNIEARQGSGNSPES